ncbi:MAG: DUF4105 domain-containing protein [Xanthomonadales bacterium]|nr:DUF4105 domain-containing protein [Xanthomonadales bacterium]
MAKEAIGVSESQVWLVTYGPGEIYWQRFGHNAIWVRDESLGLDHAFNFGFFDFEQERFFLRFLQGRMLYFSAAHPVQKEFSAYVSENRSIRAQRLNLPAERKYHLIDFLLEEVRPESRDYLYDYYLNNCSTRVRDALDMVLQGAMSARLEPLLAHQTFRDHTRRLTQDDFWLYLGLEIVLGAPVDRQVSRWDEMFIPAELAAAAANMSDPDRSNRPFVLEDVMLFESSLSPPAAEPAQPWPRYLGFSTTLLAVIWALLRLTPIGAASVVVRSWLGFSGLVGLALIFFWFGTDHSVARFNLNLLVFNPLWLVFAFRQVYGKLAASALLLFSVVAVLMPLLPPQQYTLDVLATFLPLNLACAWFFWRRAAQTPSSAS